jgi:hypothetical protein
MRRVAGAILAISLTLAAVSPGTATAADTAAPAGPSAAAVANAQAERAALGLPADAMTVGSLLGSAKDVGAPDWGISMTAAEEAAVDLPGRSQFSHEVSRSVLPYARTLPGYGGAYFDAASRGELIVILKDHDQAGEAGIAARMPAVSRGLRFAYRALTEKELGAAVRRTETVWDGVVRGIRLERASVDLPAGRVVVEVAPSDLAAVQGSEAALTTALGAPVTVQAAASDDFDTSCTDRDHCVAPVKAGIRLYQGAIDNYNECTLGWPVVTISGGDGQFVTSGHCGYTGSNSWLHPGAPGNHVLGTEQATAYGNNGHDAMRVSMVDSNLGYGIYGESRTVKGESSGTPGMTVCDSRGHANVIDCGTVSSIDVRWYSNTGGYYVYGGSTTGIAQIGGDSGSPLYYRYNSTDAWVIGIVDTSNANFTLSQDIDTSLGCYFWTP